MIRANSTFLSIILSLTFSNAFNQTLKLRNSNTYSHDVGSDLIFEASSFTKKDSFIVIKSDLREDSIRINVDFLFLQFQKDNKNRNEIFSGTLQYPGFHKVTSYMLDSLAHPKGFDTVYLYIPSAKKSQEEFPIPVASHLPFSWEQEDVSVIAENLRLFDDSIQIVLNKMLNLSARLVDTLNLKTNKVETVALKPYEIDSGFNFKLDEFASNWATQNLDSGNILEGYMPIDLNTGVTIISWKADPKNIQNSFDSFFIFKDALLDKVISLWKEDRLITDDTKLISYLAHWRQASKFANLADTLCFFKRQDNYIVPDILKQYRNSYRNDKSNVFFGFNNIHRNQLIIAFRIIGSKPILKKI